jgi:outer membrane receptor for ferrienterochelin and colicins
MRDKLKKILLLAIITLSPVPVFAKSLPLDLTELSLEDLMNVTVSTVSKYAQSTSDAPSSVTIIKADEIKKYGYRTLADILESVKGFYTSYDRNYSYLGLRGFSRPGDYNTRTLFLVDGHRINSSVDDSVGIGTDFIVDVDLIDRVEIASGPSFSLYGNNAFFGTVNVITKNVKSISGAEISASYGSNQTYNGRFTYGKEFGNGLNLILSASGYDSRGNRKLYYKEFDDPATNNGIAQLADKDNNYSFLVKTSFKDFSFEGSYISREKMIPTAPWGTVFNDPRTRTIDSLFYGDLKYEHHFDNQLQATARISYNNSNYHGKYVYDLPPVTINKDFNHGEWFDTEIDFVKKFFDKHTVIMGMEYAYNMHIDQGNYDESPYAEYLDDKRKAVNWGVFAQDEFAILDYLTLNLGVRYDNFQTFGGTTNPRVALIYRPLEETTFKLIYGSAFRAPNSYELYYNDGPTTMKSNPNLGPETIRDYEAIIEQSLGDHFNATVLGYYYNAKDLINQTIDPEDGLEIFKNADKITSKGIEFELRGHWDGGREGKINYSHSNAQDRKDGVRLTNSPVNLAKLNLIIPVVKERFFLGLEEQYTGKRKTLAGNEAGEFMISNVTLFSKDSIKGLEISGSIYNLFNKRYSDPGAAEHLQDTIEQDGRTFRLKVVYSF